MGCNDGFCFATLLSTYIVIALSHSRLWRKLLSLEVDEIWKSNQAGKLSWN